MRAHGGDERLFKLFGISAAVLQEHGPYRFFPELVSGVVHRLRNAVREYEEEVPRRERDGFLGIGKILQDAENDPSGRQAADLASGADQERPFVTRVAARQRSGGGVEERVKERDELLVPRILEEEHVRPPHALRRGGGRERRSRSVA